MIYLRANSSNQLTVFSKMAIGLTVSCSFRSVRGSPLPFFFYSFSLRTKTIVLTVNDNNSSTFHSSYKSIDWNKFVWWKVNKRIKMKKKSSFLFIFVLVNVLRNRSIRQDGFILRKYEIFSKR